MSNAINDSRGRTQRVDDTMKHFELRKRHFLQDIPGGGLEPTITAPPVGDALSAENNEGTDYRLMVEKINEGIIVTQNNTICYANPRAFEISGYAPEEITGRSLLDFVHPEDREMVAKHHLNRTAGCEQPEVYLLRILHKQGQVRWIKNNGALIDWQGRPATLNLLSDITRQKEVEDALKANESRFQIVAEQTGQLIYEYDIATGKFTWAGAIRHITGYSESEFMDVDYRDWERMIHPDDRDRVAASLTEACRRQDPFSIEYRFRRNDGTFTLVENKGVFLSNDNGRAKRVLGVLKDISTRRRTEQELQQYRQQLETQVNNRTEQLKSLNRQLQTELKERRLAEDALRQSEERYRFLIETMSEGYYLVDHDTGNFVYANQKVCDMLEYTPGELPALTIWDILAADDHQAFRRRIKSATPTPIESPPVYNFNRRNGSAFRGEISISVDHFQGRKVIQGIIRDVTENERFLNRLQGIQKLETIATLAGGIAHDFNNILMAMQGNVSLLLVKLNTSHPLYGKVENIQEQIRNGANLIRQLLGFARGGKYEAKVIDVNRLIADTAQMINPAKKRIRLETRFQEDIWMVQADRGQIEQTLLNIMVNAWQAMPNGGRLEVITQNRYLRENEVELHELKGGKFVHISIRDTGIGMDAETMKRIFDPFFTTKDSSRGTGLGLSSVYGIIKNHGGFIEVESRIGEGSTFDIFLPATDSTLRKEPPPSDDIMIGDETVLLVDDEEMILEAGEEMLSEFGYRVHAASDGEQALAMLKSRLNDICLVVLDWNMPGMSGPEILERMCQISPSLRVLVTSGQQKYIEFESFIDQYRVDFLAKPFTAIDLSQKIRQLLDA